MHNSSSRSTLVAESPRRDVYSNGRSNGHTNGHVDAEPTFDQGVAASSGNRQRQSNQKKTWSIKKRIVVGFGALIGILIIFAVTSYIVVGSLAAKISDITTNWMPGVDALSKIEFDQKSCAVPLMEEIINTDPAAKRKHHDAVLELIAQSEKDLKDYQINGGISHPPAPDERPLYDKTLAAFNDLKALRIEANDLAAQNKEQETYTYYATKGAEVRSTWDKAIAEEVAFNLKYAGETSTEADTLASRTKIGLIIGLGIALLVGITISYFIIISIIRPLGHVRPACSH